MSTIVDAHVEFHFLSTPLLNFQNKETSIFAVFTLQDEHTIFYTMHNLEGEGVMDRHWTLGYFIYIYMK